MDVPGPRNEVREGCAEPSRPGLTGSATPTPREQYAAIPTVEPLAREFARVLDELVEGALAELFAAAAERDLNFAQLRILRTLSRAQSEQTLGSLISGSELPASAVRRSLRDLAGRGLVAAELARRHPGGRASLTPSGRELLRELEEQRLQALSSFIADRDAAERLRLAGGLHLLDRRFPRAPTA